MKSFKLALLAITTALILQGCGEDSDSDESPTSPPDQPDITQPDQPDIDTEIVGMWSSDDAGNDLSVIVFTDDGNYVQTQVNASRSKSDPENGMESGTYSINSKTGKLTATPIFDKNGNAGLSDAPNPSAKVVNGKLILEVDENDNGIIDSNEIYRFSEVKPEGILGSWSFDNADEDELVGVAFLENNTYIYVQVDDTGLTSNPENGMEWGTYAINTTTKALTTTQFYDDNDGVGLSESRTRYARVTGDTDLTIEVDNNQNGVIDDNEKFMFSRNGASTVVDSKMLSGLWRMDLGNEELVTLSFLDDGTYVQTQVTGPTSSRGSDNGIEWGEYSLKANNELEIDDVIFDNNGSGGLSDDVLRTVQITDDMLTLGVDENDSGIVDNNEKYQFAKAKSENELGIWRASPSEVDDELILFAFLEDNTFMHIEIDEEAPFDVWDDAPSGLEWNTYTLGSNGLFTLGQSLYSGSNSDLSDFYNMTIDVNDNNLLFTIFENQEQIDEEDGEFVNFFRQ
ncbi:hypothetical protein [Psychrobacter sp. Ps2]|uniref:hypothetical protein n=1 Tax=Psychrobacter sp. Ps2 TaxID=2790956 RepID=UPI001EDEE785|nr:hypothetical protein [Psychrobacter sp. Ps2]MCG3858369.1 hypothetical protein [Psychrobacter sp. Ps2]